MKLLCKHKTLSLLVPQVMGIINMSEDSFYKDSCCDKDNILYKASQMVEEGATILDVGGQSTRPGSSRISVELEKKRVLPAIELLMQYFPHIIISVDTFDQQIAKMALEMGADMINDVSGGAIDGALWDTVSSFQASYVLTHSSISLANSQQNMFSRDITEDMSFYFESKIADCKKAGLTSVILDPGFGFGKTMEDNFVLLKNLASLQSFQLPILVGLSRKSMIWKSIHTTATEALNGTSALHMVALQNGANILRVHDVKEAKEVITLFSLLA